MKEQSSFLEQARFSQRILRSLMPNEHPELTVHVEAYTDTAEKYLFLFSSIIYTCMQVVPPLQL